MATAVNHEKYLVIDTDVDKRSHPLCDSGLGKKSRKEDG